MRVRVVNWYGINHCQLIAFSVHHLVSVRIWILLEVDRYFEIRQQQCVSEINTTHPHAHKHTHLSQNLSIWILVLRNHLICQCSIFVFFFISNHFIVMHLCFAFFFLILVIRCSGQPRNFHSFRKRFIIRYHAFCKYLKSASMAEHLCFFQIFI